MSDNIQRNNNEAIDLNYTGEQINQAIEYALGLKNGNPVSKAVADGNGNNISNTYLAKSEASDLYASKASMNDIETELAKKADKSRILQYVSYEKINTNEVVITGLKSGVEPNDLVGDFVIPEIIEGCIVTEIRNATFKSCNQITSMILPSTLKKISGESFAQCTSMASINIPSGIQDIYDATFADCISFTEIHIPIGVKTIRSDAFSQCSTLKNIYLPRSITEIQSSAFSGCSWLTYVYYEGSKAEWDNINISSSGNQYLNSAIKNYNQQTATIEDVKTQIDQGNFAEKANEGSAGFLAALKADGNYQSSGYMPGNLGLRLTEYEMDLRIASLYGEIVQCSSGTQNYVTGYFYQSVLDGPNYEWRRVDVQPEGTADLNYNPNSTNAQSGVAVAEAVAYKLTQKTGYELDNIVGIENFKIYQCTSDRGIENAIVPGETAFYEGYFYQYQGGNVYFRLNTQPVPEIPDDFQVTSEWLSSTQAGAFQNRIVQCKDTGNGYTQGYFYISAQSGGDWDWQQLNVQPGGGGWTVDQNYNPNSTNAQSGTAVKGAIERLFINVLDHGVYGDGDSQNPHNDTTALQEILATVRNTGKPATIYLPNKEYKITGTLNLNIDNLQFLCEGAILYYGNSCAIKSEGHGQAIEIRKIKIFNSSADAIQVVAENKITYNNIYKIDSITSGVANNGKYHYGVYVYTPTTWTQSSEQSIYHCKFDLGEIVNCDTLVRFDNLNRTGSSYSHQINEHHVWLRRGYGAYTGLYLYKSGAIRVHELVLEGIVGENGAGIAGVYLNGSTECEFRNIRWNSSENQYNSNDDSTKTPGIVFAGNSGNNFFYHNYGLSNISIIDYDLLSSIYETAPTFAANKFYKKDGTRYSVLTEEPTDWNVDDGWKSYYVENADNFFNSSYDNNNYIYQNPSEGYEQSRAAEWAMVSTKCGITYRALYRDYRSFTTTSTSADPHYEEYDANSYLISNNYDNTHETVTRLNLNSSSLTNKSIIIGNAYTYFGRSASAGVPLTLLFGGYISGGLPKSTPLYVKDLAGNIIIDNSTGNFVGKNVIIQCVEKYSAGGTDYDWKITFVDDIQEIVSNKVTTLSSSSTDTEYPSAKCVYDLVGTVESALQALGGNSPS